MRYYVVDAFTDTLFRGNPAGVCLLDRPLDDDTLQRIAAENNLSETAFLTKREGYYDLRWFTPELEIDLCGHATLASAFVLFGLHGESGEAIEFHTMSGIMTATRAGELLYLDFPAWPPQPAPRYHAFEEALDIPFLDVFKAQDFMLVFENQAQIGALSPDFAALKRIQAEAGLEGGGFGVVVTARGDDCDFVSRFFAPGAGIDEDPVTGRAHCMLIPYWAGVLGKADLRARQLSRRTGELDCRLCGDRVRMGGKAALYLTGEINL